MQHLLFPEPNRPNDRHYSPSVHLSMYTEFISAFSFFGCSLFQELPARTQEMLTAPFTKHVTTQSLSSLQLSVLFLCEPGVCSFLYQVSMLFCVLEIRTVFCDQQSRASWCCTNMTWEQGQQCAAQWHLTLDAHNVTSSAEWLLLHNIKANTVWDTFIFVFSF
jgi:hypothetical protein